MTMISGLAMGGKGGLLGGTGYDFRVPLEENCHYVAGVSNLTFQLIHSLGLAFDDSWDCWNCVVILFSIAL